MWRIFLLALWLSPVAQAAKVLVVGDSLSAGYGLSRGESWVDLLQLKVTGSHQIINSSVSGETSAGGLSRLPALLERERPDWLILELGANDGLRGLPLNLLQANLQKMIELSIASKAQVLLIGVQLPPNFGRKYNQAFSQLYQSLAAANKLALVPSLFQPILDKPERFQSDGLHPDALAQPLLLQPIWQQLQPLLAK
jgi:acyl-CoA thioesterase-1